MYFDSFVQKLIQKPGIMCKMYNIMGSEI